MNKLEETTSELLDAGYTIEEIKEAFEEVIDRAKHPTINTETNNN